MGRVIPAHLASLVEQLGESHFKDAPRRRAWNDLARLASDLERHFAGASREVLSGLYSPLDPDDESVPTEPGPASSQEDRVRGLFERISHAFEHANFEPLDEDRFLAARERQKIAGIRRELGLERIDRFAAWWRGEGHKTSAIRFARSLFRVVNVDIPTYSRAAIAYRLKGENRVHMRMYKDLAQEELHLLFPTARLRMRLLDIVKLSTSGSAAGYSAIKLILMSIAWAEASSSRSFLIFLAVLVACTMYGGKTWLDYTNIKASYLSIVAEHLHALGVASNGSVVTHVSDLVAEEEAKEVLVAYALLQASGEGGRTPAELRDDARAWIRATYGREVDFDVPDALAKLEERSLVRKLEGSGRVVALSLDEAVARLAKTWDELRPTPAAPPAAHESI